MTCAESIFPAVQLLRLLARLRCPLLNIMNVSVRQRFVRIAVKPSWK